jgi:PAS domain S-box-containing protein
MTSPDKASSAKAFRRKGRTTGRWGAPALGAAALLVVGGLVVYGLIHDRTRLIDTAVEALDGESGMYESYLRRAVAGWDETLLALGDRLRAGASPEILLPLATALTDRSPLVDGISLAAAGRATGAGKAPECPPGDAGLTLRLAGGSVSGDGVLAMCRSFGGGVVVGATFDARRMATALAGVKENWASTLETALSDGRMLFALPPDASQAGGSQAGGASLAPAGRLLHERGEALSARTSLVPDEIGRRWLISERQVTGYPLLARAYAPIDRTMNDWRRRVAYGALLAGLASVFFIGGVVVLARNAALRERLLDRLAESEAEATAIFNRAFQFIVLLDLDGRILRLNDTTQQAFGVTSADVVGRLIWETVWRDMVADGEAAEIRLKTAVGEAGQGGTARYESRLRRGGGDFGVFDVVVKPVRGADGMVREVLLEARDVTDIAQARETLERSERLAALGGLVAGIAHEVNTPVGVATTSASYLIREVQELRELVSAKKLTASRMQEFLGNAEEAAQLTLSNCDRAAQIITSFKQVAVDQTGGERRRFLLAEYIDEVLTSLRPRLKREPHVVEVDCPADLELVTDPGALSHGLTNLMVNALVHAFEPGQTGRIRIAARLLDDGDVKLVFSDDGKGIPPELHAQVFDPFFTTRRGAGGSGLGLHILHKAVTGALRGRLRLVSDQGKGTAFVMTFPRVLAHDVAEKIKSAGEQRGA